MAGNDELKERLERLETRVKANLDTSRLILAELTRHNGIVTGALVSDERHGRESKGEPHDQR